MDIVFITLGLLGFWVRLMTRSLAVSSRALWSPLKPPFLLSSSRLQRRINAYLTSIPSHFCKKHVLDGRNLSSWVLFPFLTPLLVCYSQPTALPLSYIFLSLVSTSLYSIALAQKLGLAICSYCIYFIHFAVVSSLLAWNPAWLLPCPVLQKRFRCYLFHVSCKS